MLGQPHNLTLQNWSDGSQSTKWCVVTAMMNLGSSHCQKSAFHWHQRNVINQALLGQKSLCQ